jgi:hypothetical protein
MRDSRLFEPAQALAIQIPWCHYGNPYYASGQAHYTQVGAFSSLEPIFGRALQIADHKFQISDHKKYVPQPRFC